MREEEGGGRVWGGNSSDQFLKYKMTHFCRWKPKHLWRPTHGTVGNTEPRTNYLQDVEAKRPLLIWLQPRAEEADVNSDSVRFKNVSP